MKQLKNTTKTWNDKGPQPRVRDAVIVCKLTLERSEGKGSVQGSGFLHPSRHRPPDQEAATLKSFGSNAAVRWALPPQNHCTYAVKC